MQNSRTISSNQPGPHRRLAEVVRRHAEHPFRRPIADHSQRCFEQLAARVAQHRGALIFDSFCGVGESTQFLARQHPEALIIGIDKSLHRLDKHQRLFNPDCDNYLLLRADTDDLWRLAAQAGWTLSHHYLFYPNPWPKSAQLQRRIHGSALFPSLLALGGRLELRSNWPIYVEEFAQALQICDRPAIAAAFTPDRCITPFERKYQAAGHSLWRCISEPR